MTSEDIKWKSKIYSVNPKLRCRGEEKQNTDETNRKHSKITILNPFK